MCDNNSAIQEPLLTIDELFQRSNFVRSRGTEQIPENFGEREYFEQLNPDLIPPLTKYACGSLHANSLCRYRGLIQDIYEMEYYSTLFENKTTRKLATSKFQEILTLDDEFLDCEKFGERLPLLCVPIPGESSWAQWNAHDSDVPQRDISTASLKRQRNLEDVEDEASHMVGSCNPDGKAIRKNSVSTNENLRQQNYEREDMQYVSSSNETCCLVKMYEGCDYASSTSTDTPSFKLNDVIEVIGVYAGLQVCCSGMTGEGDGDEGEESKGDCWLEESSNRYPSASIAPRVHCISFRKICSLFPLFDSIRWHSHKPSVNEEYKHSYTIARQASSILPIDLFNTVSQSLTENAISMGLAWFEGNMGLGRGSWEKCRQGVLCSLSRALCNDMLVAEYVLLCVISRVLARREDGLVLGPLVVNICNQNALVGQEDDSDSMMQIFHELLPRCCHVKCNVETFNNTHFSPLRDYDHNQMLLSPLQVARGSLLVLDERELSPGRLLQQGMESLKAVRSVACSQVLPVQCGYAVVKVPMDVSVLVLSSAASNGEAAQSSSGLILSQALAMPSCSSEGSPATVIAKIKLSAQDLVNRDINDNIDIAHHNIDMTAMRLWLTVCRSMGGSTPSPQPNSSSHCDTSKDTPDTWQDATVNQFAEDDFVQERQRRRTAGEVELSFDDFHRWLTLARLLAVSFGHSAVTVEDWRYMRQLEERRLRSFLLIPSTQ